MSVDFLELVFKPDKPNVLLAHLDYCITLKLQHCFRQNPFLWVWEWKYKLSSLTLQNLFNKINIAKKAYKNTVNIWATTWQNMSSGVTDQARHKPACPATEAS